MPPLIPLGGVAEGDPAHTFVFDLERDEGTPHLQAVPFHPGQRCLAVSSAPASTQATDSLPVPARRHDMPMPCEAAVLARRSN